MKDKLDLYGRHQLLLELITKFGEKGFELFEKARGIIEDSEPEQTDPEQVNQDNLG